jgi:alpha-glucosidase
MHLDAGPMASHRLRFAALAALALAAGAPPGRAADDLAVTSPDGRVQVRVAGGDRPTFEVRYKGKPVVEPSPLAISVDGVDLCEGAELGKPEAYRVNERYPRLGGQSGAFNRCNGLRIPVRHPKSGTRYTLELRAYDDAVAFRHVVPGDGARVPDEATTFVLPEGSTVWHHDLGGHYEAVHRKNAVADVPAGQWVAPPMTYKLPGGLGYASITEAGLTNASGMALRADGKRGFAVVLGHAHPPSYPFRLRYAADVERLAKPAVVTGPITSAWRVVMIGADLNALVNCDIVANLAPPPDPKLFPAGARTDWVKPGRAVWKYLDGGQSTPEGVKEFSKLAGELGFEYQVVEGFWSRWSDEQLRDVVDYSRRQGVGLWFWRHSNRLRTAAEQEAFFKKLHDLGVVGAKIDFFDHEHKEVVDLYQALLEGAARHRILVNFHGANKPTGEPRTWPNELTREGVRGMESSRLQERARHDATLPFTRFLAGHADYTPVHFGARKADTTAAHQIATAAVFAGPLLTYGAHPRTLLGHPTVEMIRSIPATWDETRVLPGSEVGEVAVFARRSGDTWFVAVVNGPDARSLKVPLTFLGPGEYRSLTVRDRDGDPDTVRVEEGTARRGDTLTVELAKGGGFVARFTRK